MTEPAGYLLDNAQAEAGVRFDALAELLNPGTFRHLTRLGIAAGWRCWEVGAGNPSVAEWMAQQVGDAGHVLATDIDVAWLTDTDGVRVLCHDVATDAPPDVDFDLIHVRLVLLHLPERDLALANLVAALWPGGWLLLEEADPGLQPLLCPDEHGPAQILANRLRAGFRRLMATSGADLAFGRTLPRRLREAGLLDVEADSYSPMTSLACTRLELATVQQIRERLVSAALATEAEIDDHLRNVATGTMDLATAPLVSAWGRKPRP